MSALAQPFDRRDSVDAAAVAIMLFLTFSWGLNGVAAKISGTGFGPVFMTFFRSAVACAVVFAWCRWRGIRLFDHDGTMWAGVAAGVLFSVEFVLIFWGLDYTTVARSALMVNTMPFWVLIGAHFLLGESMSWQKLAGTMLAFLGVVLVFSDKLSIPGPSAIFGDILSLVAGVAWAATTLVIKTSKLATARAEKLLLYQLAASAVITLPLLAVTGPAFRTPSALATWSLVFQAVVIVAFTFLLWFWLMRRYPASGLASFAFLTPAFGVLLGALILDEPLSWRIFAALVLIGAGLVIVNRRAAGPKRGPEHAVPKGA